MTEQPSLQMARNIMLAAQGLDRAPIHPVSKIDVLQTIRRMCLLQIDTIHVVARSPYLVLWSRLGDFPLRWLDELLAEGDLFEQWAHAYCFIPIEDYSLYRRQVADAIHNKGWPYKWAAEFPEKHPEVIERVRAHLRQNGAVRSSEFENTKSVPGGWWNWKEEKDALESMLLIGEVMVARRQNFQRVYDLRERVLPSWNSATIPTSEELKRTFALRAVRALGIALPSWVADYFRQPKQGLPKFLEGLAAEGQLLKIGIQDFEEPAYFHPDHANLIEEAGVDAMEPTLTTLLSPFDPLVWDRARASRLFGFDYKIECYTPAAKRRYGYFTLPILHRGQIIGRLDPKAHRAQGVFEIRALHFEPGVHIDEQLVTELAVALRRIANWHGTPVVTIRQSYPASALGDLEAAIRETPPNT